MGVYFSQTMFLYSLCFVIDVGEHGEEAAADSSRGKRRGECRPGWSRLRHAVRRNRQGGIPTGGGPNHAPGMVTMLML